MDELGPWDGDNLVNIIAEECPLVSPLKIRRGNTPVRKILVKAHSQQKLKKSEQCLTATQWQLPAISRPVLDLDPPRKPLSLPLALHTRLLRKPGDLPKLPRHSLSFHKSLATIKPRQTPQGALMLLKGLQVPLQTGQRSLDSSMCKRA